MAEPHLLTAGLTLLPCGLEKCSQRQDHEGPWCALISTWEHGLGQVHLGSSTPGHVLRSEGALRDLKIVGGARVSSLDMESAQLLGG